ncbi:hypothetical protein RSAG8_06348, partial [Rhizoctonia solani AG-8 WAC10335]
MLNVYDYKHYTSEYWMSEWERTDVEQLCIDNILVNGKGQVKCPNMTEINSLAASYQKPLTNKGCMYPNNTLMFPYPDSKPSIVDPKMWYNCSNTATTYEVFTAKESDGWVSFMLLVSNSLLRILPGTNLQGLLEGADKISNSSIPSYYQTKNKP